jgi:hypothetical protein
MKEIGINTLTLILIEVNPQTGNLLKVHEM